MEPHETTQRLAGLLIGRFTEAELRQTIQREFPGLAAQVALVGSSLTELAFDFVESAQRRGSLQDVERLLRLRPRQKVRIWIVMSWAASCAGSVSAGVFPVRPGDAGTCGEDLEVGSGSYLLASEVKETVPEHAPTAFTSGRKGPVSATRPRQKYSAPISGVARAATAAVLSSTPSQMPRAEAASGPAVCRGGSCRLTVEAGLPLRQEEVCISTSDGEQYSCTVRGRGPALGANVPCDLAEFGSGGLVGSMRWRVCRE